MREEFIPIVVFSATGVIVYLGGILNCMIPIIISILIIGIYIFAKEIYVYHKIKYEIHINYHIIFFAILMIYAIWRLNGIILTDYDNFSHWGLIVKDMFKTNHLPNFESTTIMYQAYPPATACFIFFICKCIGYSETSMLMAQSFLMCASLYTLFAFGNRKNKISYVMVIFSIIYILINNIFITQLLLDTILSAFAIASLAIIIYYKNNTKKGLLLSIPVLSFLIIMKNSGIFFVIADLIVWIYFYIKQNGIKSILKNKYCLIIFIPLLLTMLWKCHINLVFETAETSVHSMSITNYMNNLNEKLSCTYLSEITMEEINIIEKIIEKMSIELTKLSINSNKMAIFCITCFISLLIITITLKNKELLKTNIRYFLLFIITYIVYLIGLLGMYIFSMDVSEAISVADIHRYYATFIMFGYAILLFAMLNMLTIILDKKYIVNIIMVVVTLMPILIYYEKVQYLYDKDEMTYNAFVGQIIISRNEMVKLKNKYDIEEEKSYLIYKANDLLFNNDYNFFYNMCRYELFSPNVKTINSFSEIENIEELENYDYLILMKINDETIEFVSSIGKDTKQNVLKLK